MIAGNPGKKPLPPTLSGEARLEYWQECTGVRAANEAVVGMEMLREYEVRGVRGLVIGDGGKGE